MSRLLSVLVVVVAVVLACTSVVAAMLPVPYFNQCDSRWSSDQLGGDGPTICSQGCALTSAAMVMAYYGVDTDPQRLNDAIGRDGYDATYRIYWSAVRNTCHDETNQIEYSPGTVGFDTTVLNNHLDAGHPVIVYVYCPGYGGYYGGHFVVVTGRSDGTYYINDPASSTRSTLDDYPTRYGMRIFSGNLPVENTPIPLSGDLRRTGDMYGFFNPINNAFTFYEYRDDGQKVGETVRHFGTTNDIPVIGDWDGDGYDEIGIYRPDNGVGQSEFHLVEGEWDSLSTYVGAADKVIQFGSYPDDIPIAGDWDGDGDDDIGGFYPVDKKFYLYTLNWGAGTKTPYGGDPAFGEPSDNKPIIGDWDGDGDDDIGMFRPKDHTNEFHLDLGLTGGQPEMGPYSLGNVGDEPLIGNWSRDGGDNLGVYRPVDGTFHPAPNLPPDTTDPIISISYPANGQTFTTATITVSGSASDNVGLNKVEVKVNSGSWQTASGPWTSWSKLVTLSLSDQTRSMPEQPIHLETQRKPR